LIDLIPRLLLRESATGGKKGRETNGTEGKATARAEKRADKPGKQAKRQKAAREKPVRVSKTKSKRSEVKVAATGKNGRKTPKN
jgi:hypothetical protein